MKPWLLAALLLVAGCQSEAPLRKERKVGEAPAVPGIRPKSTTPSALATKLQTKTPVLTYHDVIPTRGPKSVWFDCTEREFRDQLDWLQKRGATFVTLDQLYAHLSSGSGLPKRAVCLTFADNYQGFYRYALPILRQRKIPAAMFVHTGFVGSPVGRPKMDWNQLAELADEGLITIASQTISHPADLRDLDDAQIQREFVESKRALEARLKHPVRYLAYPNGKWNARVAKLARAAGYAMAFSEVTRPAESSESLFSVNRYVHTKTAQAWADAYGRP